MEDLRWSNIGCGQRCRRQTAGRINGALGTGVIGAYRAGTKRHRISLRGT